MNMYEVDNTGEMFGSRDQAMDMLLIRQTQGSSKLIDVMLAYVNEHKDDEIGGIDLMPGFNYICDCMDHCEAMWEYNRQDMEASLMDPYIKEREIDVNGNETREMEE